MRNFQASAVERRITIEKDFASQPMEAGWASEAIFFIWVEEMEGGDTMLQASVQISPDGINWIDEGSCSPGIRQPGYYFVRASQFGNWLRLNGIVTGTNARVKLSIHLHLKE